MGRLPAVRSDPETSLTAGSPSETPCRTAQRPRERRPGMRRSGADAYVERDLRQNRNGGIRLALQGKNGTPNKERREENRARRGYGTSWRVEGAKQLVLILS